MVYNGSKFETIFLNSDLPSEESIKELYESGKKFSDFGLAPGYFNYKTQKKGSYGNLSCMLNGNMVITCSDTDLGDVLSPNNYFNFSDCFLDIRGKDFKFSRKNLKSLVSFLDETYSEISKMPFNEKIYVCGKGVKKPSSETLAHLVVYLLDPRVKCIEHCHSDPLLKKAKKLKIPTTNREWPYGTPHLALGFADLILNSGLAELPQVFNLKEHGSFFLGNDLSETTEFALELHNKAKTL